MKNSALAVGVFLAGKLFLFDLAGYKPQRLVQTMQEEVVVKQQEQLCTLRFFEDEIAAKKNENCYCGEVKLSSTSMWNVVGGENVVFQLLRNGLCQPEVEYFDALEVESSITFSNGVHLQDEVGYQVFAAHDLDIVASEKEFVLLFDANLTIQQPMEQFGTMKCILFVVETLETASIPASMQIDSLPVILIQKAFFPSGELAENLSVQIHHNVKSNSTATNIRCIIEGTGKSSVILSTNLNSRSGTAFLMEHLHNLQLHKPIHTTIVYWLSETKGKPTALQEIYRKPMQKPAFHLHLHSLATANCLPVVEYTAHAASKRKAKQLKRLFESEEIGIRVVLVDFSFALVRLHCEKQSKNVGYSLNALQVMSLAGCLVACGE